MRAVLLSWRGLPGPERKVKWVRSVPGLPLAWGAIHLGRTFSPKWDPVQPQGTDAQRLFKPGSMPLSTRRKKIESMLNPLTLLMKRRQGCWGGGSQRAGKEAFTH